MPMATDREDRREGAGRSAGGLSRRWWVIAGLALAAWPVLYYVIFQRGELPGVQVFIGLVTLGVTALGLLVSVVWRRRARERDGKTGTRASGGSVLSMPVGRAIKTVLVQVVVYLVTVGLGHILFAMFWETNPVPQWATPERIESAYADQIAAARALARKVAAPIDGPRGVLSDDPAFRARPELLSVTLELRGRDGTRRVRAYQAGPSVHSAYSHNLPVKMRTGQPPAVTFWNLLLSDGKTGKAVQYHFAAGAPESSGVWCDLLFDAAGLRERVRSAAGE